MKNDVFWDTKAQVVPNREKITSPLQSPVGILGCKHTVRTSQETYYVSAIETSRLMLYKYSGFHGGIY
jgi:hypothetical protein